ncbi:MAG: shikimate dehydrogenase [Gammaproteobacteria bacterium]|nr:shikimate dehydrogenase [Gammaproteobacteria bacterium]
MTTVRCGLIGHPVAHSRSPDIHRAFAAQASIALDYVLIDAEPGEFPDRVREFFADGGRGLNVTLPHKAVAFALAEEAGDEAWQSGVANVLTRLPGGRLRADNTDGIGLVRELTKNLGFDRADRRILIAGAGGVAAGIIPSLLAAKPREIVIANRTPDRAARLVKHFENQRLAAIPLPDLRGSQSFDLVINATSASLEGKRPDLPDDAIGKATLACDLVYADEPTPFMRWATALGARTADGGGMLVEQAAESFLLWHGIRPDTVSILHHFRSRLQSD